MHLPGMTQEYGSSTNHGIIFSEIVLLWFTRKVILFRLLFLHWPRSNLKKRKKEEKNSDEGCSRVAFMYYTSTDFRNTWPDHTNTLLILSPLARSIKRVPSIAFSIIETEILIEIPPCIYIKKLLLFSPCKLTSNNVKQNKLIKTK